MDRFNNYKCGEIYITYKGIYSYICIICRERFDSIEFYEDHYMVQHFESKELYGDDGEHFESKELYGDDGERFPIKVEPMTEHDLESIKSEVDSEYNSFTDLTDTEHYNRTNVSKSKTYLFSNEDSDPQDGENAETNELVVTIKDSTERDIEVFDHDILEWNDSDQEISIDEMEIQEETQSNNENFDDSNVLDEKQDVVDDPLTCEICSVRFASTIFLDHVFQHKENGVCPLCKKEVDNLNKHNRIIHKTFVENTIDTKLKKNEKSIESRKRPDKRESISCKYCNKKFFLMNALEQHEQLHENQRLNCEYCNKSYRDLRFLRYHKRKHTGERPFKCEHCTAAFTTKDNLNTHHIYKHTDTYNFSCSYEDCDKKFKTKELRKRHIKNIHLKVLGYQCDICGQEFMTSSRLSIHRVKSHVDPEEWPFKCEFCEKSFILQCKLREHINSHTGEKPFKCDLCDQHFMKRRALNEHKKKHVKK